MQKKAWGHRESHLHSSSYVCKAILFSNNNRDMEKVCCFLLFCFVVSKFRTNGCARYLMFMSISNSMTQPGGVIDNHCVNVIENLMQENKKK